MKVVICWSHISGYMAAAWRALAGLPGVSVFLVAFESDASAPFDAGLLGDIPHRLLNDQERYDTRLVRELVLAEKPDVLLISGWSHVSYRAVAADPKLAGVPKMMTLDTQLRFDARQALGRYLRRSYFKRITRVISAGERAAQVARYMGFRGDQIKIGFCGVDLDTFGPLLQRRLTGPWPRKFLYVGRYAPEKGLDVLADGYARYRAAAGDDAWDLVCCGTGPEAGRLRGPGVRDLGFVPPDRQAAVFADAGAFVMASAFEPWGVAIAEGAAAGLPLVCSDACGANAEVLRDGFNGYIFATGSAADLARNLARVTRADLPQWGARSRVLGEAFSAADWPHRVFDGMLPTR